MGANLPHEKDEQNMILPNREHAFIPLAKLKSYLLSETHAVGRSKAKFFRGFGFNDSNIHLLEQALLAIAHNEQVRQEETTTHGAKYTIDGWLQTPIGRTVRIRTVWIMEKDTDRPRFVTAMPN